MTILCLDTVSVVGYINNPCVKVWQEKAAPLTVVIEATKEILKMMLIRKKNK